MGIPLRQTTKILISFHSSYLTRKQPTWIQRCKAWRFTTVLFWTCFSSAVWKWTYCRWMSESEIPAGTYGLSRFREFRICSNREQKCCIHVKQGRMKATITPVGVSSLSYQSSKPDKNAWKIRTNGRHIAWCGRTAQSLISKKPGMIISPRKSYFENTCPNDLIPFLKKGLIPLRADLLSLNQYFRKKDISLAIRFINIILLVLPHKQL